MTNPGKTAREFVDGNRVNHYKPIVLVFVLSGLWPLLAFKVLNLDEAIGEFYSQMGKFYPQGAMTSGFMSEWMTFVTNYNSFLMLALIPVFAIATKIAFWKWGHNYYEHVVLNAYILSFFILAIIFLVYPIAAIFVHASPLISLCVILGSYLLTPLLLVWFFKGFYPNKSLKAIILRVLAVYGILILGYLGFLLLMMIIGFIAAILFKPEVLQNFRPQ